MHASLSPAHRTGLFFGAHLEEPQPILARIRNTFSRIDDEIALASTARSVDADELEHLIELLKADFSELEATVHQLVLRTQPRVLATKN